MIVGHKKQFSLLKNSFLSNVLPHAFLFSGPEKIGKKRVAIEFAKFINCSQEDYQKRPCGKCRSCQTIEKNQFPDFLIIEPEAVSSRGINRKEIKIIQIRKMKEKLSLKRYSSPVKIVIIDDAHYLNQESQSALLKILEEPKGKVLIILITHLPHLLLPTIRSRVQEIKFQSPSKKEIYELLKAQGISEERRDEIYFFSFGKIGRIIEFLRNEEELSKREELLKEITEMDNKLLIERFNFADSLIEKGEFLDFLEVLMFYLRILLFLKVKFGEKKVKIGNILLSSRYSLKKIKELLETSQRISSLLLFSNVNPKIALRMILIEL